MTDRVSVAPMMDWTDRHCRYFFRLISRDVRLYTEMRVAQALISGDADRLLAHDARERPVALQLGGSEPALLADAVRVAAPYGYDEMNLNIGCPSNRVQSGRFGACLMAEPAVVADCVNAMMDATDLPVTVKTRIGIDDCDDYGFLRDFVARVAAAGCRHFIVHARKALLTGLSPKDNRSIPPLRYDYVYRLKEECPELSLVINGGIESVSGVREHLARVDGVMIGRKAYGDPFFLARLQDEILDAGSGKRGKLPDRAQVLRSMAVYAERQLAAGTKLHQITRHMLGLFNGCPGARRWRRFVSERSARPGAGPDVLIDSLALMDSAA